MCINIVYTWKIHICDKKNVYPLFIHTEMDYGYLFSSEIACD